MTANAFMSVSLEPPLVLISVDRRTQDVRRCSTRAGRYGVSVLCEPPERALGPLRRPCRASADAEPRFDLIHDTPLVDGALAHFVAKVCAPTGAATTRSSSARVEYARYNEGAPLLFHGGRYERLGQAAP